MHLSLQSISLMIQGITAVHVILKRLSLHGPAGRESPATMQCKQRSGEAPELRMCVSGAIHVLGLNHFHLATGQW